jgi:hypothetical protein
LRIAVIRASASVTPIPRTTAVELAYPRVESILTSSKEAVGYRTGSIISRSP